MKALATLGGGLCKTAQADLIPRIFASDLELMGESCRSEAVRMLAPWFGLVILTMEFGANLPWIFYLDWRLWIFDQRISL